MEAIYAAAAFVGLKASTIIAAVVMAALGFLLDSRRHSFGTAMLAIAAGTAVAVLMTDPITDYLHLTQGWQNAVAGILGISGRNFIMVVNRLSKDPGTLVRMWRGQKDDGPE